MLCALCVRPFLLISAKLLIFKRKLKLFLHPYLIPIKTTKLHKPLYNGVIECLENIFVNGYYTDKVLERTFKVNRQWGARDRGFVAHTVYEMVRHWRLLHEINGLSYLKTRPELFDQLMQTYLFIIKQQEYDFAWKKPVNRKTLFDALEKLQKTPEIACSFPQWMHQAGQQELGPEAWEKEMYALNQQARVVLRVNTLKTTREKVKHLLDKDEIGYTETTLVPNALVLDRRINIFTHEIFKEGLVEVQDEGSQAIGEFCGVKPGMRVIDACAGAGGKTLHLAALMQNKGKIVSMDVEQWKLEETKKRARRAAAFNVEPRLIEGTKTIKKLEASADLVLLDVPCSGTGVLRRNPDAKWKLQPASIEQVKKVQHDILQDYAQMVKPGGTLVYSTCSIFPSENQEQVKLFLAQNPGFELEEEKTLSPYHDHTDGFYMARLKRKKA